VPKPPVRFFDLAKRGAEVRFRELVDEAKSLIGLFPHLRDAFDPDELPLPFIIKEGARRAALPQSSARRSRMSPAARRAASERMKRHWAARRKGKKT
jgi:hypothetical protein